MERTHTLTVFPGQIGTGPVATHPVAGLGPEEQGLLGWLVEGCGGGPVELDDYICKLHLHVTRLYTARPSIEEIEQAFEELTAGGYLRRTSEAPVTYRVTSAGFDAAIGYGALTLATDEDGDEDDDTREETVH